MGAVYSPVLEVFKGMKISSTNLFLPSLLEMSFCSLYQILNLVLCNLFPTDWEKNFFCSLAAATHCSTEQTSYFRLLQTSSPKCGHTLQVRQYHCLFQIYLRFHFIKPLKPIPKSNQAVGKKKKNRCMIEFVPMLKFLIFQKIWARISVKHLY